MTWNTLRAGGSALRRLSTCALLCLALIVAATPPRAHGAQIRSFDAGVTNLQAGAHSDSHLAFEFELAPTTNAWPGVVVAGGAAKDIVVELPQGFVGNVRSIQRCTSAELNSSACPPASQVGVANLQLIVAGFPLPSRSGVFNMVPARGELARLGMAPGPVVVFTAIKVSSGSDPHLIAVTSNTVTHNPPAAVDMTLWGIPNDPIHEPELVCPAGPRTCRATTSAPKMPFLANPTECGVDGFATITVNSYQRPDEWSPTARSTPQQVSGCELLSFNARMKLRPTTSERGQPTGLEVTLDIPQTWDNGEGLSVPPLRDAIVTFPEGTTISPGSADGLQACSDADLNLDNEQRARCPNASKIGEVEVTSPLIPDLLRGGVYLRPQASNDPASGEMFRIAFEVANEDRGLNLKIPGAIAIDPRSGQVTARFTDNPQLPFEQLRMWFKSGPRAPLALPTTCGVHTIRAVLTGWGVEDRPINIESPFMVTHNGSGAPCPRGFTPSFEAGSTDAVAGKETTFALTFGRDDDDQELSTVTVEMPQGLLGYISRTTLCSTAQANAGACPESARIGDVLTAAGSGPQPFYLRGRVYVTEGYKGAPFGLSIVVPAVAGPFNLGEVVVRAALHVNRITSQLRVVADPMPTIVKGVLTRIQTVNVHVNRPGFMINPTSCEEKKFGGQITSTEGAIADIGRIADNRFQVGECGSLDVRPRFALRVGGRGRIQRGRTTPLRTTLRMPRGGANLKRVVVTLPTAINARLTVINEACTREQYDSGSDACEFAKAGEALAVTPLLHRPLRGSVYFVKNGNPLPDLFVRLRGQVDFDLIGRITIPGSTRLRTTFATVPDVPVSLFELRLQAGRRGSLGNAMNLCSRRARRQRATISFVGQNGERITERKRLRVAGCRASGAAAKKAVKRNGAGRAGKGGRR